MSKATKRKSSSSGSQSRSSSIGAREKRLSVFDRLGTKALPGEPPRLCRHNIYHAYCPTCRTSNSQLPSHSLSGAVKRGSKKEGDLRPSAERGSPETDWANWDQADLEYEDEKALERRRQLLQRELELQINSDLSTKHNNNIKKRSSSSSSLSSSTTVGSSSSSSSSSQKLDGKKNFTTSPQRSSKKFSKMVYKESSPGRKNSMGKKSPSRKMYKKSLSPNQAATSRKSPTKRLVARKKDLEGRDRSRQRSLSRERRRGRSKEGRHRQRAPHTPHSSIRGSERKKDEERSRRGDDRRDRRSGARDSRRAVGEMMSFRQKLWEKEQQRCSQRAEEARRDKCGRSSRPGHQVRTKESAAYRHESTSRHSPLSPNYHHHYRTKGERSRYGGSSERERVSGYKELSPREQESRLRLPHPSSSNYTDSTRIRRRGWEAGRYDSPKASSRDWEAQSANERVQEWQRTSKHAQDKEFACMAKDKDIDWKRSGGPRDADEGGASTKRARLDEPPPPPPPPPIMNEPDLSDISDDPDDILNRDDADEGLEESRVEGLEEVTDSVKEEESQAPLSTASSNLEHRLLDQRIGEDEGMDSLDFEEISDEDLEEESKNKGSDVLVEDWASFIAECRVEKKPSESEVQTGKPWDTNNILRRIGISREYAGETLFNSVQKQLTEDGGEGLLSEVGGIQSALLERKHQLADSDFEKVAISARSDLAFRRQLCGLPVVGIENYPLHQYQAA